MPAGPFCNRLPNRAADVSRNWSAGVVLALLTACGNPSRLPQPEVTPAGAGDPVDTLILSTASGIVRSSDMLASLWPGYWPRGQGFILASPGGYVLLVSSIAPDSGFQPLRARWVPGALRGRAFTHYGPVRGLYASSMQGGLNIHYAVAGMRVTAVAVKDSIRTTAEFLLHEAFHAFQDGHFVRKPEAGASQPQRGTESPPEFDAMAEVERRILADALLAADEATTRDLVRSVTAVRSKRLGLIGAPQRAEELQMERIEGSAQLVGVQGSLVVIGAPRTRAVGLVRDLLTAELTETDPAWRNRLRVYGTGAALGLLLDRIGLPWRSGLQGGATFDELLASAFPMSSQARDSIAESALARFGNPSSRSGQPESTLGKTDVPSGRTSAASAMKAARPLAVDCRTRRAPGLSGDDLGCTSRPIGTGMEG